MAVKHRRDLGLLQAKLFEEEACRGMALRQQKVELDVLHMEAEARYMEAMSSRVSEAEMRMAHAEEVARRFAAEDEENNLDSSSLESRATLFCDKHVQTAAWAWAAHSWPCTLCRPKQMLDWQTRRLVMQKLYWPSVK